MTEKNVLMRPQGLRSGRVPSLAPLLCYATVTTCIEKNVLHQVFNQKSIAWFQPRLHL